MTEPAPLPIATPPGWYHEPTTGRQRWWDGIQWAFYAPKSTPAPAAPAGWPVTNPYAATTYSPLYRSPKNGLATASLVLSLVGLFMCVTFIPSLLAVGLGIAGIFAANEREGVGRRRAIWGLCLGAVTLALVVLYYARGFH